MHVRTHVKFEKSGILGPKSNSLTFLLLKTCQNSIVMASTM